MSRTAVLVFMLFLVVNTTWANCYPLSLNTERGNIGEEVHWQYSDFSTCADSPAEHFRFQVPVMQALRLTQPGVTASLTTQSRPTLSWQYGQFKTQWGAGSKHLTWQNPSPKFITRLGFEYQTRADLKLEGELRAYPDLPIGTFSSNLSHAQTFGANICLRVTSKISVASHISPLKQTLLISGNRHRFRVSTQDIEGSGPLKTDDDQGVIRYSQSLEQY
ncbi:MAG: hypothetical protein R3309_11000, partial [Reinekea sp.]|nr:hypothetical protein [Reinekea sp.]